MHAVVIFRSRRQQHIVMRPACGGVPSRYSALKANGQIEPSPAQWARFPRTSDPVHPVDPVFPLLFWSRDARDGLGMQQAAHNPTAESKSPDRLEFADPFEFAIRG